MTRANFQTSPSSILEKSSSVLVREDCCSNFTIGSIPTKYVFAHNSSTQPMPGLVLIDQCAHGQRPCLQFIVSIPIEEDATPFIGLHGQEDAAEGKEREQAMINSFPSKYTVLIPTISSQQFLFALYCFLRVTFHRWRRGVFVLHIPEDRDSSWVPYEGQIHVDSLRHAIRSCFHLQDGRKGVAGKRWIEQHLLLGGGSKRRCNESSIFLSGISGALLIPLNPSSVLCLLLLWVQDSYCGQERNHHFLTA